MKLIIVAILAAVAGAAIALYFYCPQLCKRGVQDKATSWLEKLGLPSGISHGIVDDVLK